jgi:purine-binding chemotaxis protein CheW
MSHKQRVCTFLVDGSCYGVEVLRVQEIIRAQPLTRVPRAPHVVRGLINLRGRIVTVLDLRRRLELAEQASEETQRNVVVRTPEGVVSLLVDEIGDVLDVEEDAYEPPPETLDGVARDLIRGAYKLPDRLLLILDIDRVLSVGASGSSAPEPRKGGQAKVTSPR